MNIKKGALVKEIISDEFWNCMKDLFTKSYGKPGRPPMSPREALSGIMYVLENGCKWRFLPKIYGPASTVHGTFMRWAANGVFEAVMKRSREFYFSRGCIPKWCAIDSSSSKAPYATWAGKNPTDRSKHGIKKSIATDWYGTPIAIAVGPANRHDSVYFDEIVDDLDIFEKDVLGVMEADSAYDAKRCRNKARSNNFVLFASTNKRRRKDMQKIKPGSRWKVEPSHSWLNNFRGLKICWTKSKEAFKSFLQLGASILMFRRVIIFG